MSSTPRPPAARRRINRTRLAVVAAIAVAVLLGRGITAPWFIVHPSTGAPTGTVVTINGTPVTHSIALNALAASRADVVIATPGQGTLTPLALATPASTPGTTSGLPMTIVLAGIGLLLVALAATRQSALAALLGFFGLAGSMSELGGFLAWGRRPDLMFSHVTYGPGVANYQLSLWVGLGLSVGVGSIVLVRRLVALGAKYNAAVHANDHEVLAQSALDRFSRAFLASETRPAE